MIFHASTHIRDKQINHLCHCSSYILIKCLPCFDTNRLFPSRELLHNLKEPPTLEEPTLHTLRLMYPPPNAETNYVIPQHISRGLQLGVADSQLGKDTSLRCGSSCRRIDPPFSCSDIQNRHEPRLALLVLYLCSHVEVSVGGVEV